MLHTAEETATAAGADHTPEAAVQTTTVPTQGAAAVHKTAVHTVPVEPQEVPAAVQAADLHTEEDNV